MLRQLAQTVVSNQQNIITRLASDAVQDEPGISNSYTPTRTLGSARQMEDVIGERGIVCLSGRVRYVKFYAELTRQ
eukprot:5642727-Amphidinium_carterae.1